MIIRERYLKRLRPFYDSELVKVLMGVRRCGKSTLLLQIIAEICEKTNQDQVIYINFEDYQYHELCNPDNFYKYVEDKIQNDKKYYLFFDEIQNVTNFELVINSFRATHDCSIFITGSNSKLLSGELSSHLGGRTISYTIMPFSFKEFCDFFKAEKNLDELLQDYMQWGGLPIVCKTQGQEEKKLVLSNLYDSLVLKDIIMRNKISSTIALEKIIEYLIANSSLTISVDRIVKGLKQNNIKISIPTVYEYLRYIEEACLITKIERYDIRGKKVLAFEEKVYAVDLGLFQLKKNRVKDDYSLTIETICFNELISRGYKVYVGKTYKGEVDFIAEKDGKKVYIQATYLLYDEDVIEREFNAFNDIKDNYPKYVISCDKMLINKDGIIHMNLIDFLMNIDVEL